MRSIPAKRRLVLTMPEDSRAAPCKAHWPRAARTLNAVQTAKYPETKIALGTYGWSRSRRLRFTVANVRIIGTAEGSIIATIISPHIKESGSNVPADHGCVSGPDIFIPAQQHTPVRFIVCASRIM